MPNKREQLSELATKRKTSLYDGYFNLSDFHDGLYDGDFISPYTKSAGNLDAETMIIGQDWASQEYLEKEPKDFLVELGYDPSLPTNKNLIRLLSKHLNEELTNTYMTNLFPFIKPGGMSEFIPAKDYARAALDYALPQIEIISPRKVICLGMDVYNTLAKVLGYRRASNLNEATQHPLRVNGSKIYAQAHTGGLGRANRNRGGIDRVSSDWSEMASSPPKRALDSTLAYGHAYHQLPVAHEYEPADELYIKNLICLEHANEQHEKTGDSGWKLSIESLTRDIQKHAKIIADRRL